MWVGYMAKNFRLRNDFVENIILKQLIYNLDDRNEVGTLETKNYSLD